MVRWRRSWGFLGTQSLGSERPAVTHGAGRVEARGPRLLRIAFVSSSDRWRRRHHHWAPRNPSVSPRRRACTQRARAGCRNRPRPPWTTDVCARPRWPGAPMGLAAERGRSLAMALRRLRWLHLVGWSSWLARWCLRHTRAWVGPAFWVPFYHGPLWWVWGAALTRHRPEVAGRKHAAIGGRHQVAIRVGVTNARRHWRPRGRRQRVAMVAKVAWHRCRLRCCGSLTGRRALRRPTSVRRRARQTYWFKRSDIWCCPDTVTLLTELWRA